MANTILTAIDTIRKEIVHIEDAKMHSLAYKECKSLICVKCGDKIDYKHGEKVIPYFAHDQYGDGHSFCPLYTPGNANHPIARLRYRFYSNINIELYYFVTIENDQIRYFIMLPKLSKAEIGAYCSSKCAIRVQYQGRYKDVLINHDNFTPDKPRCIELGSRPSSIYLRFYEANKEKTKLAFSCDERTSLFTYIKEDNRIILRKCYDKVSIGSTYAFFSYKKYSNQDLKNKGFTLLYSKENYYLYSVVFEKLTIDKYMLASDKNVYLSLNNTEYDYTSDFRSIKEEVYKENIPAYTPTTPKLEDGGLKIIAPHKAEEIPTDISKYLDYIIVVDNKKASVRGFAIINDIKRNASGEYMISVNFFKNDNYMPCNIDAVFKFDTTEKYYKLLPPVMMDRIRGMKSTLVGYEKLLKGFNDIPLDYFKQWYSYDFHLNHFKALIAEIIINRKPIIANKSTAAALAQMISGLLKHESYYECNLSEQYEINSLEIADSETIIFNKFFNSKRSLDDFLKLDNLNRNSIKLFTITKSGLEENKDLIKDRFIFFDYILEPLNEYEKYNKLDVDWTSIKWYSSYDYVSNLNLFPLRKNDIELNMLSAALIYRPTIKRLYPELLQRFDWINSNYKPGIIEEIRRYLNLVKHI